MVLCYLNWLRNIYQQPACECKWTVFPGHFSASQKQSRVKKRMLIWSSPAVYSTDKCAGKLQYDKSQAQKLHRARQLMGILPGLTCKGQYKAHSVTWKTNHCTLRSNKEHHLQLPRSQMKWGIILPNPAGHGRLSRHFPAHMQHHISLCFCWWAAGARLVLGVRPWAVESTCAAKDQHLPWAQTRAGPKFRLVMSTCL